MGKFVDESVREWSVTFGVNLKWGIWDADYEKYLFSSFIPLISDLNDQPELKMMLKVDSGQKWFILWLIGADKYPSLQNPLLWHKRPIKTTVL